VLDGIKGQELADQWGVSRQRVDQIKHRALDKLKRKIAA
jgi:DNA-directed RNA polymerase sigma subunit (sigma70/sigma32)